MNFNVQQAKRELIWSKVAMLGASGSGKTYSALRLASGMLSRIKEKNLPTGNGKILLINTEGSRGLYYANEFKYDIINTDMAFPGGAHNPENYVEALVWAEKEEYPICIIDSSSAEWEGKGGCLELHQLAGGTFQSWGKVTPRHDKFIQAIANTKMHVIATMRGKDQYEIEKGEKLNVKKLGVGARQRDGFEYEFTSTFSLDTTFATSQKDNTHIFENKGRFKMAESDGEALIDWANSGEGFTPRPILSTQSATEDVGAFQKEVVELCISLGGQSNTVLMDAIKKYTPNGSSNPNTIKDVATLKKLKSELLLIEKPVVEETAVEQ